MSSNTPDSEVAAKAGALDKLLKPSLVGHTVLYRISKFVQRPLLVHTEEADGTVAGELFVNHEKDWPAEGLLQICFFPPDRERRTVYVKAAKAGTGIGEWEQVK